MTIESEQKYRELVEGANSIIMEMDVEGKITFLNPFAQKFFGFKNEELLGRSVIGSIVPATDTAGSDLAAVMNNLVRHPEQYLNNENENMLRDGTRVWIAWTNKAILGQNGRVSQILCIGNNITKLKQAEAEIIKAKEAAESANRAKSSFLANMSHELRTPLTAIIGFSELMRDGVVGPPLADKQKQYIGHIWESGNHLLSLINDILDLSKVEAGKMELELGDFSLPDLVSKSLTFISERAVKRHVTLASTIEEGIGVIRADERKIKQVLYNLLSNAVKFTPSGGRVEIDVRKNGDGSIVTSVRDSGIGIEKADRAKVFTEFEQIDNEFSRKYAGTGLGMPLSKKFVELHGGKIDFESEGKGKGTRFYFTIPARV